MPQAGKASTTRRALLGAAPTIVLATAGTSPAHADGWAAVVERTKIFGNNDGVEVAEYAKSLGFNPDDLCLLERLPGRRIAIYFGEWPNGAYSCVTADGVQRLPSRAAGSMPGQS